MSRRPRADPGQARTRIWDGPTRLVHGLIVVLVAVAWWTEAHDEMAQHLLAGYALAGVVVFRVLWGFVGGSTARFASFVRGPATVLRYARGLAGPADKAAVVVGHNLMGGWSVVALLGLLAGAVGTGLFASDTDGVASGALASKVSYGFSDAAAHWLAMLFDVLLRLIALHLPAVGFYLIVRRENLVSPMIHGRRWLPAGQNGLKPARWIAVTLAVASTALAAVVLARA